MPQPRACGSTVAAGSGPDAQPPAVDPAFTLARIDESAYHIISEHDRGGLGRILRARDQRTGRIVAIKETLGDSRDVASRFQREALITANLQHPAIVPVYEVGCWSDGRPFYAMKLVGGGNLRDAVEKATSFPERLLLLVHVITVADALAFAHSRGVIHRDLKPANVLVGDYGETVVIDWGLAKDVSQPHESAPNLASPVGSDDLTRQGTVMGTPAYMPPEQARGEELDARADVYSLGAMLYHVLCGQPPFDGSDAYRVVDELLAGPPRPLAEVCPEAPGDLVAIIDKAMAREPTDRYASAGELSEDLRRFQAGKLVRAHTYTPRQILAKWIAQHRVPVAVALVALAALVTVVVVSYTRVSHQRDIAVKERAAAQSAERDATAKQKLAEEARTLANLRSSELQAQLARIELSQEEPQRALIRLAASLRLDPAPRSARSYLTARALESVAIERRLRAHGEFSDMAQSPDWRRLVSADSDGLIAFWSPDLTGIERTVRISNVHARDDIEMDITDDGALLATGGEGAMFWAAKAQEPRTFEIPGGASSVALSADATLRAVGSFDGSLHLFSEAGSRSWQADSLPIHELQLAFDKARVATIGKVDEARDSVGAAKLWRTDSANALVVVSDASAIGFSRDGTHFLVAVGNELQVRSARSGKLVRTLTPGQRSIGLLSLPDDRILTIGRASDAKIWGATGAEVVTLPAPGGGSFLNAAASIDGTTLATCDGTGRVQVWDSRTGERLRTLLVPGGAVLMVAFSKDGRRLVAMSDRGEGYVWDLADGRPRIPLVGHGEQTRRLVYAPDSSWVATGSRDGTVRRWDTASGRELAVLAHGAPVVAVDLSPDGQRIVAAGKDGDASVSDLEGQLLYRLAGNGAELTSAVFAGAGDRVITAADDGVARVWAAGGTEICSTAAGASVFGIALAPDGRRFAAFVEGPESTLWGVDDCQLVRRFATGHQTTLAAHFSSDGKRIYLAGYFPHDAPDGTTAIVGFDLESDGGPIRFEGDDSPLVGAIDLDSSGKRLVAADLTGQVRVFDTERRESVISLESSPAMIAALLYVADDQLIVGGGEDGAVRVWSADDGLLLTSETGHATGIYYARLRPDGAQFATAALEAVPRLWSLPSWAGTRAQLDETLDCLVPLELAGNVLMPRVPSACTPAR